tara:strand:- start:1167 stop:1817 length:651 start_codon:yes stop_codon:yes gene_type:complete
MYTPVNFVMKILPYSLWIAYDIKNKQEVQKMLPTNTRLANVKIFDDEIVTSPKLLFNSYSVDSAFMKGKRCEILTIAESRRGKHFVILDCLTDTLDWNPSDGIKIANSNNDILYSRNKKELKHRVVGRSKKLFMKGTSGISKKISKSFVVEPNKNCYYRNIPLNFYMTFDVQEVSKNVIKLNDISLENGFWDDYKGKMTHCFYHEQEMTYTVTVKE